MARYLHERVGNRRDREFGSAIMQRHSDQLFLANEPREGKASTFNWDLLLDRKDPYSDFLHPDGFKLVASFHSHPDMYTTVQKLNPEWTEQQIRAHMSFYSTPDIMFNLQDCLRFTAAYLSGPDGTLLKYQPSNSPAEVGFINWLKTNGPWTSPHAHNGTLEGVFKKLASVGRLSFILSSSSWGGSVGDVPADWEPYKAFNAAPLPQPCGPVFASRDLAMNYAGARTQRQPTLKQQVLILQSTANGWFTAAEPQPVESIGGQLPTLPVGLHLHGIYVHSRPLPAQYPDLEDWLYKNFISPLELAQHIARFRGYANDPQPTLGASLFIRMRDDAVLRYQFSGSAAESQLFVQGPDGEVSDNGLQAHLNTGRLLTRAFVWLVAQAGELTVEKTSALWDRVGVVDATWLPFSTFALPALSRAFLTADDAARYAHVSIGGRRDRLFAGLILERSDGRFVVTEPESVVAGPFLSTAGYPKDRQGSPIVLHPGYRLQGRYGSCAALSTLDREQVERLKWTRQEAELHGQMLKDHDVHAILQSGLVAYLSGTPESLISYQRGEASSSWKQQWQPDASGGMSPLAKKLESGSIRPADVVRTLAASGTLRVRTETLLWGPAEKVEVDWEPFVRVLEFQRPDELSYGAIFDSADAAALDVHRREPERARPRYVSLYFAFIFKHQARDEYIASELVPVTQKTPLLSLPDVADNAVPEGFACHGVYYSRQWAGDGAVDWLSRFFIVPQDLSIAVIQLRNAVRISVTDAAIYIAPPEGALLRYCSPSTNALFEAQSTGDTYENIQARLDIGTLTPPKFVRMVAQAGDLQVIHESPCWDRSGNVPQMWNPYAHIQRRRLSPAFLSMDDAARYVRRRVPVGLTARYAGVILLRDDGWFLATEPVVVPDEVFDIKRILPDALVEAGLHPMRTLPVACYHSRPAMHLPFLLTPEQEQVYSNMISTRVLAQMLDAGNKRMQNYLLGPDGSLISLLATPQVKYPLITNRDVITRPRNRHDWLYGEIELRLRSGDLTPTEYVNRVAETFILKVVVGSSMWGITGPVSGWRPYVVPTSSVRGYARAHHDPACSPVCTQLDDAAHCAHKQVAAREELSFGYLLKSTQNGNYTATLPIVDGGARFAHRRVFSDAGYPYRYEMAGLYFCVPQQADFQPKGRVQDGDGIYQGLFSPYDLKDALALVHATATRASLPLYISCADGALLKFVVRNERFIQYSDLIELRIRKLSPRDYIRRMAAAGDLRVLHSSDNWPGLGVVGSDWQPGRSRAMAALDENRLVLGPIHAHGEDAAHYAHGLVGGFSGKQYLSAQLESLVGSCYLPVLPLEDNGYPSLVAERLFPQAHSAIGPARPLPDVPKGYQISATHLVYHAGLDQPETVGESQYRQYFVSWRELGFYLHELKRKGLPINRIYLSTRDGALLSYLPTFSNDEINLFDSTLKWSKTSGYSRLAPKPSWVITELARIGELRVIHPGGFWRQRGRVRADFKEVNGSYVPDKDEL
ncbi:DUF4329 domain-containing protein [Pseudomonas costantinii]|uniref:DUF4329 domain-containing protein n=1 Tax=Pseudomonas costantinii TaxID=168469 RepID=UPI0015A062ED|nr:DUF4329 domain-containing protein [Pseudomonas costantinii]